MKVITLTCKNCGTIVAANELEDNRVMKCPGLDCSSVIRFDDLPESDQQYFLENREKYQL